MQYDRILSRLIEQFQKLPGVGPKSAQRMAFHMLKMPYNDVEKFAQSMIEAKRTIKHCKYCYNMSSNEICDVCASSSRDKSMICVVAETKDLIAVEKTQEYRGIYHVLQGLISPMEGVGPEDIRIKELLERVVDPEITEIILALNPSIEGEATSLYLTMILKPFNIKITRIAFGLPFGGELEHVDELTLAKAIEGRQEVS